MNKEKNKRHIRSRKQIEKTNFAKKSFLFKWITDTLAIMVFLTLLATDYQRFEDQKLRKSMFKRLRDQAPLLLCLKESVIWVEMKQHF